MRGREWAPGIRDVWRARHTSPPPDVAGPTRVFWSRLTSGGAFGASREDSLLLASSLRTLRAAPLAASCVVSSSRTRSLGQGLLLRHRFPGFYEQSMRVL
jgi:hypothetical protein